MRLQPSAAADDLYRPDPSVPFTPWSSTHRSAPIGVRTRRLLLGESKRDDYVDFPIAPFPHVVFEAIPLELGARSTQDCERWRPDPRAKSGQALFSNAFRLRAQREWLKKVAAGRDQAELH